MTARSIGGAAALAAWLAAGAASAYWMRLLEDDFGPSTAAEWSYAGATNASGQTLFRRDPAANALLAEWDQSNVFDASGDPFVILNSRCFRPLARALTDRDTFRFGATLRLEAGSVPETTEFYQIGVMGLYGLEHMGPDRTQSDNWSTNTVLLKDGSDFVEFDYFIGRDIQWWGRMDPDVEAVIGAHIEGMDGDLYFNYKALGDPLYHETAMTNSWLPTGTNLYVQVEYHGGATNAWARRARAAVYTDPQRTNLLVVDGREMYFWTVALPGEKSFRLTDLAFFNYACPNLYGPSGGGRGTFDDAYVDRYVAPGEIFEERVSEGGEVAVTWAAEAGTSYFVRTSSALPGGGWVTQQTTVAVGETATWTNPAGAAVEFLSITREGP